MGKKTVQSRRKRTIGIIIILIIGTIGGVYGYQEFLTSEIANQMLEEAEEKLTETANFIEQEIPSLEELENFAANTPLPKIENLPSIDVPELKFESEEERALNAIAYINEIRHGLGKNPINYDQRVFDLAKARIADMNEYDYYDHSNPITGNCPDKMKSSFGLKSNEYVAENLHGNIGYTRAIDDWMESPGHRNNLVYHAHYGGAVACGSGSCVFLGLNKQEFGKGCYTAAEGEAQFSKLASCTQTQLEQLDSLREKFDKDLAEYNKLPKTATSQAQYQQSMKMYNDLNRQQSAIDNFQC